MSLETAEYRIAENFRNIDYCIHDLEAGLLRGAYGSKTRWDWLLDSISELSDLLNQSQTFAQSLADTGLRAKVLALTHLAGTSIEVKENLPLLMALSRKDFVKAEQTILNEVNKCRAVCQRDFIKIAAELEICRRAAPPEIAAPRPILRHPMLDARDKWLYEECCKLVPYGTIIRRLDKKPQSWLRITTVQGVKKAAKAYAERQTPKLRPIPKRARGRIAGK